MFTGLKWYIEAAIIAAVAAAGLYGWHLLAESYRNEGRVEIRAQWTDQKLVDAKEVTRRIKTAVAIEHTHTLAMAAIATQLEKDKTNAKNSYDKTIADLRSGITRMRIIATQTKTLGNYTVGVPGFEPSASVSYETSEIRLPQEIGISAFGIGADADDTADQLRAAQKVIIEDRKICPLAGSLVQ